MSMRNEDAQCAYATSCAEVHERYAAWILIGLCTKGTSALQRMHMSATSCAQECVAARIINRLQRQIMLISAWRFSSLTTRIPRAIAPAKAAGSLTRSP